MSIDTSKDPIYQTVQGVWDCLAADNNFAALVPAMNRIDYTADRRTSDKQGLTSADLPQVRVVVTGFEGQYFRTSNSSSVRVFLAIEVKIGDKRLEKFSELAWAIYCAMSRWETYLRDAIEWESEAVCKKLHPLRAEVDYAARAEQTEPAGWTSIWAAAVELFIKTSTIQSFGT